LASAERLARFLGLTPGSVTLFGLVNDRDHQVTLLVDRDVWEASAWRCHPLVNTATLVVSRAGIERFLAATGHGVTLVSVSERSPL
jgi:Ala-tRNA(Pro) deacylase